MLITKVKVGKITNLSEARYCAGMGVDLLSFPISSVDPKTYQEITGWVAGPMFGIELTESDLEKFALYNSDFIHAGADLIERLPIDKKLVVSVASTDWSLRKSALINAKDRILFLELIISKLDANTESIIDEASKVFQVIVLVLDSNDLEKVLKLPIAGISLEGSSETKVGLKEYPLAEILEQLETRD